MSEQSVVDRRIEKLKRCVGNLQRLLADPHPGLFTWMAAVAAARVDLNAIMDGERDD